MPTFKDYLDPDLSTFTNLDEFAEPVEINGVPVTAVIDDDKLQYRISRNTSGLITGDKLFFISTTEYAKIPKVGHPPKPGDALLFNGKPATITSIPGDCGLFEVIIQFTGR